MADDSDLAKYELLEPFPYFIRQWPGVASGKPGHGQIERAYAFILNNQLIQITLL